MLKILHIIPSVSPLRGGPSISVPMLCSGLVQAGVEVTLATTDDDGDSHLQVPLERYINIDGVTRIYFHRDANPYTISLGLLRWLDRNAHHFDLVHIHAVFSHVSDWAPRILWRRRIPYGISPRGILNRWSMSQRRPRLKRLFYLFLVGPNLRKANFIHLTSSLEKRDVEKLETFSRAVIIPNGVPFEIKPNVKRELEGDSFTLLFLSRIDPKKGIELVLQAMSLLFKTGRTFRLVVAGNGNDNYINYLKKMANDLNIAPNVEWIGFVGGETKETVLANADAFVLTSHDESFGMAPLEAMAAGLPILISDQVGIFADVAEAKAGLIAECNPRSIAQHLAEMQDNVEMRRRMGRNGQNLVRERFSIGAISSSVVAMYERALSRNN